jgi:[NiFe] hydrogenase diaphorase moiety large subunit
MYELLRRTSHCGLGETAVNAVHDTWQKFRPAYERRLQSHDFSSTIDLEAALAPSRRVTGRDDADAHLGVEG